AALYALRDVRTLLKAGMASLVLATLPFVPIAIEHFSTSSNAMARTGEMIESTVRAENVLQLPALLYAVLVRGPRIMSDAFLAGGWTAVQFIVFAVEALALFGLIMAVVHNRLLTLIGLAVTLTVAIVVAWLRAATPFWMTFALLPLVAALIALGLHQLC